MAFAPLPEDVETQDAGVAVRSKERREWVGIGAPASLRVVGRWAKLHYCFGLRSIWLRWAEMIFVPSKPRPTESSEDFVVSGVTVPDSASTEAYVVVLDAGFA